MDSSDDLEVVADLRLGMDALDRMGHMAMPEGALATFMALEPETRDLVLRLLGAFGSPSEADYQELHEHPAGQSIAQWLLTLPAYRDATYDDDADDDA